MTMNIKSSSSKSSDSTTSKGKRHSSNTISKLRRLKIEEKVLLQSLEKLDRKGNYEVPESENSKNLENMNAVKKLKDSYINIKNLFDEVKTITCSQELLAELDIAEIKKKVYELETTLKSFKVYLSTEINLLKIAEQETMKQMEEINLNEFNMFKKRTKINSANYNQIIPSPVRLQMNSPYKCIEVQEFQDFMKNSPNRYGGWNEYHHNLFVKYWQKHFGNPANTHFNDSIVESLAFENFVEETLFKLQGVHNENLMSHVEWYKKYLFLKDKQQSAIDKWKSNRMSIRKVPEKVIKRNSQQEEAMNSQIATDRIDANEYNNRARDFVDISRESRASSNRKIACLETKKETKSIQKKIGQDAVERHMKPTTQWLSRNYKEEQKKTTGAFQAGDNIFNDGMESAKKPIS